LRISVGATMEEPFLPGRLFSLPPLAAWTDAMAESEGRFSKARLEAFSDGVHRRHYHDHGA